MKKRRIHSRRIIAVLSWKVLRSVIIFGLCFFIIYPFITKLADMFKSRDDLYNKSIKYIPLHFTREYLQQILWDMKYVSTMMYTAVFCGIAGALQTAVSALTAYGLARFRFRGNRLIFALVILTLLVPPQTIIMTLYVKFRFFLGFLNLINTPWPSLILSAVGLSLKNGLYIFLFRQFFRNFPKELEDASYIDGNNEFQTFVKIIVPSSVTMVTTIFLLAFCWQWTDTVFTRLFWPGAQIMLNRVGLSVDTVYPPVDAMLKNASAVLAVLPLGVLYIFAQNLFTLSIERSGITG
jgi:multiple sugar transport system permease protein